VTAIRANRAVSGFDDCWLFRFFIAAYMQVLQPRASSSRLLAVTY
jgi:hypothetical protein